MYKGYTALNYFILERVTPIASDEERRRIYIVILLTGLHLLLTAVEVLQPLLLMGQLDIPDIVQLVLSSVVIVLIWRLHLKAGIWFLIFSHIAAILSVFYNADMNDLIHAMPSFVSIIVLVKWRFRIFFTVSMFSFTLFVSWITNNRLLLDPVTPQSALMFTALGMLSMVVLTRIGDGDLKQIQAQLHSLHESEQRYRILAENTMDFIALYKPDGSFLYMSPSIMAQTGYTAEDLLPNPFEMLTLLVHPNDLPRLLEVSRQSDTWGEGSTKSEYRFKKKDGSYIWLETVAVPIRDDDGQITHFLTSSRDVSERKAAQEFLVQSENRYRQIFYGNQAIQLMIDPETGRILEANQAAVQFYGYSHDQFLNICIYDINMLSPDELSRAIKQAQARECSFFEFRHRLASGEIRDVDVFTNPVEISNRTYLYSIVIDVTKKREVELQYRSLFEQSNDAVFIVDLEGNYIHVNQRAADMFGYRLDEIINLSVRDLVMPDQYSLSDNIHEKLLAGESVGIYERTFRRKDGSPVQAEVNVELVRNSDGKPLHIQSIIRDITRRKQIETDLKDNQEQLVEAQRIAHMGSWRWDVNSNTITWSDELYHIFGIINEEFQGSYDEYIALVHPDDREYVRTIVQGAVQNRNPYSIHHRITHPQRGERILHCVGRVVMDQDDHILSVIGTAQDITELQHIEDALSQRNNYLTALHQITLDLVNHREKDDLLQAIVEKAIFILESTHGELMLKEDDDLVVKAFTDGQSLFNVPRIERNPALACWQAHDLLRPVILSNYMGRPLVRHSPDGLQIYETADIPIIIDEKCIGILELAQSPETGMFTSEQINIAVMFSHLAAVAVDNANHYEAALREITQRTEAEKRLNVVAQELQQQNEMEYQQRILAETVRDIVSALNNTLDLNEIFKLILEKIGVIIPHDVSNIMLIDNDIARIVQYQGWSDQLSETITQFEFPLRKVAALNLMYRTRKTFIVENIKDIGEWFDFLPDYHPQSYLATPISVDDEVVGFLNLDSYMPYFFNEDHANRLQVFVNQAAIAIKNARLYKQSHDLAALEERQRLARDLHDSVTQTLFAASITANSTLKQWQNDDSSIEENLLELCDLTQGALAEMRTMLLELRPNALLEADLADILRQLAESVKGRAYLRVKFETSGTCNLPPGIQVTFFRIAQEAINNVIKHAGASNLHMNLNCNSRQVEMLVLDDGHGFDLSNINTAQNHFGIKIMQERALDANINLQILTSPGQGTIVKATWINGDE